MERRTASVGALHLRAEGLEKACGETRYIEDISLEGCWVGGTVRSPVARGILRGLRLDPSFDWKRTVLVTAADIPGKNVVAMVRDDYPALAQEMISFRTQAVALVAAPDSRTLEEALQSVSPDVEVLPPVLSVEDSLSGGTIIWGDDNVVEEYAIRKGDPEGAFASADLVLEGVFSTGHQEHVCLETQGMAAIPREGGKMEVLGSMQCPYYVHSALVTGLGCRPEDVRVRQTSTGGGFGAKEEYPSVLGLHAALLARKACRPVKMVYDRKEDLLCTTKRHPSIIRHRTGVLRDGRIIAADIDIILDAGACTTLSNVVLSRCALHATGCYSIPNVSIRARAAATNTPPNGAFRGFGAPQANFAMERQMDRIADALSMDPADFRLLNLLREGDSFPCGQVPRDGVSARIVLEKAMEMSEYRKKKAWYRLHNQGASRIRKGIGLSLGVHGGGFTGRGEDAIRGTAAVKVSPGEILEILVSSTEMGQGASTVLPAIAAETLGIPISSVRHPLPDTQVVPDSGPTVASRTTMIVGKLVEEACLRLAGEMAGLAGKVPGLRDSRLTWSEGAFHSRDGSSTGFFELAGLLASLGHELGASARYEPLPGASWDDAAFRGDAYRAYSWIADVVETEVDLDSLEITPVRAFVAAEAGRAISPLLAGGQIEGGTLQALGYAYLEDLPLEGGSCSAAHLNQYLIPTSMDAPDMFVSLEESPFPGGPYGAKGLGELPLDSGAPALAASVGFATGTFPERIPITGEYLHHLLSRKEGRNGR